MTLVSGVCLHSWLIWNITFLWITNRRKQQRYPRYRVERSNSLISSDNILSKVNILNIPPRKQKDLKFHILVFHFSVFWVTYINLYWKTLYISYLTGSFNLEDNSHSNSALTFTHWTGMEEQFLSTFSQSATPICIVNVWGVPLGVLEKEKMHLLISQVYDLIRYKTRRNEREAHAMKITLKQVRNNISNKLRMEINVSQCVVHWHLLNQNLQECDLESAFSIRISCKTYAKIWKPLIVTGNEKKGIKNLFSYCSKKSLKISWKFSQNMSWMSHTVEETTDFHGTSSPPSNCHLF